MIRPGQLTEGIPSLLRSKPSAPVPASDVATALNRHMEAAGYSPMGVQPLYNASAQVPLKSSATPLETALGMPHSPGRVHHSGNPRSAESTYKTELDYQTGNVHPAGMTQEELESVRNRGKGLSPEKMEQLLDPTQVTAGGGKLAPQGKFSTLENLDQEAVDYQSGLRSEEMRNRAQSIADIIGSRSRAQVQSVTDANARISKADQNLQVYQNLQAEANKLDPNEMLGGAELLPSSPAATHHQLLNEVEKEIIGGVEELYSAQASKGKLLNMAGTPELNLLHDGADPLLAQMKPNIAPKEGQVPGNVTSSYLNPDSSFNSSAYALDNQNPTIFNFDAQLPGINHVSGEKMPSRLEKLGINIEGYDEVAHNATNANVVEEVTGVTNPDKGLFGIYDPTKDPTKVGGIFGTMAGISASGVLGSIGVGATVGGVGAYMTGGEFSEGATAGGIMGLGLRGISGAINANAMGIQRGMYKNILGDAYDPKMNQEAMSSALRDVNKESLNIGQKGMYSVLANPNKSSVGFSLRAQTLTGGFLAGSMFSSKRSDKRRGFNAHRGNRI